MADFKPHGGPKRFGNKASFGGKPSFPKKTSNNWADRGAGDRSTTFHKALCSKCGNECEVPFRPVNGKPVFCRNCFVKTGDTDTRGRAGDRFPKREYNVAPTTRSEFPKSDNGPVLKQLEILNSKIDRLVTALEESKKSMAIVSEGHAESDTETPAPKKVKKGYPKKTEK